MAIVISELTTPKNIALVNSPQYIRVFAQDAVGSAILPNTATVSIKVWNGIKTSVPATYDIEISQRMINKIPALYSTEATFDISPYIRDLMNTPIEPSALVSSDVTNNIAYWFTYDISFNNSVPTYNGTTKLALEGYGLHRDGANSGYDSGADLDGLIFGMTDGSLIDTNNDFEFFIYKGENTSNSELIENTTGYYLDFTGDGFYQSDRSDKQFYRFNIKYFAGMSNGLHLDFEIQNNHYKPRTICGRDNSTLVRFRDSLGAWSSFHFIGRKDETVKFTSDSFLRSNKTVIGIFDPEAHTKVEYNQQHRISLSLNTGHIGGAEASRLVELIASSEIYTFNESGLKTPLNCDTKSISLQNVSYDKDLNYTINFTESNPVINKA